jgi:hypothetical protein
VLGAVLVALAGCGSGEDDGGLADGRHFRYVLSIDTVPDPATLEFDVAEFLVGEEANTAAEEDGAITEGEGVPNDYYIRNEDTLTQPLDISPDVEVTRVQCPAGCEEDVPGDFAELAATFDGRDYDLTDPYRGSDTQYWLTIDDGQVVDIDEQYLP